MPFIRHHFTTALISVGLTVALSAPAGAEGINSFKAGVNGLAAFPADIAMSPVDPPEQFHELPGSVVMAPVFGFFAGTVPIL